MKAQKLIITLVLIMGTVLLASCNLPGNVQTEGLESTYAAETVVARLTEIANGQGGLPTNTPLPPATQFPTSTPLPTNTPAPTSTPRPTNTPQPTATQILCNSALFIRDMTVYDGAQFAPGAEFVKVWRLKNIGACTWNKDYDITFDGGDKMGGSTVSMPKNVAPGETVDIAIKMQAPNTTGDYKGYWLLRDDDGSKFGIGYAANMPFWVEIEVVSTPAYQYNFAANFCDASWRNDDGGMYCQGTAQGYTDFVQFTTSLVMEGDRNEDEAALIINVGEDERVRGIYPAYTVQAGDHFVTRIGCIEESRECKVKVVLSYKIAGTNTSVDLGEWVEHYDENTTVIDIDLSALVGEDVIFTLDISSRSSLDTNRMFFLVPSIQN